MSIQVISRAGFVIVIDVEDRHLLDDYTWKTFKPLNSHTRYVRCNNKLTGDYAGLLHRLVMQVAPDIRIDHLNGNGLDVRKTNLRVANGSENQRNRRRTKNLVKGVYWRKDRNCWASRITINGKVIVLGAFVTHEAAVIARIKAEEIHFGEYAGNGTEQEAP